MTGASGSREQAAVAAIAVTLQGPMQSLAATARRLEGAGVDSIWTGNYFQSGLVRAAVLGAATTGALVGTHVLQAFARSPLATALAAQDLQELTGGRFSPHGSRTAHMSGRPRLRRPGVAGAERHETGLSRR